jgi:beta-fructofuranosidase
MEFNKDSPHSSPLTLSPSSTAPSTPPQWETATCDSEQPGQSKPGYSRWRPSYHLMPPTGWMNDPCAPGYDAETGTYTVSFQWNPKGPDWGDICWGTAFSKDMTNWEVLEKPSLSPETSYDCEGVFTGCLVPQNHPAKAPLTVAYTSVSRLPIHHTLPHVHGSETLSLAQSFDNGRSWRRCNSNPVLPGEPDGLDVTGWRDPFVAAWPSMASSLGYGNTETLFGIVSGGIRNVTPTTFLYVISPAHLTDWRYIGPLVDLGVNLRPSRWSGDLGTNWEVTNFMTLRDECDPATEREFLVMGTEGCLENSEISTLPNYSPERPVRGQLWMSGTLQPAAATSSTGHPDSKSVQMTYDFGGRLDHGCLYAANSFFDPVSGKQIYWGWIGEDDLCNDLIHAQGWSGCLSLPRELRIQTLRHVIRSSASKLEDITNIEREQDQFGTFTLRTLASKPVQRVQETLRQRQSVTLSRLGHTTLCAMGSPAEFGPIDVQSQHWELKCSIRLSQSCRKAGLRIAHTPDFSKATTLSFSPADETFTIDRPPLDSHPASSVNTLADYAPHTLFTMCDPANGVEHTETLDIHLWRDNSVLEVFVNDRTAISTRIYGAEHTFGISFFAQDGGDLVGAQLWDGIGCN